MRMQCLYEGDFWGGDLGDMDGVGCGDLSAYVASLNAPYVGCFGMNVCLIWELERDLIWVLFEILGRRSIVSGRRKIVYPGML